MRDEQIKSQNTKNLVKKLMVVAVLVSTYQFATVENEHSNPLLSEIKLNAVEQIEDSKMLKIDDEDKPLQVSMTLSFDVDMGKHINKLVREFLSRR